MKEIRVWNIHTGDGLAPTVEALQTVDQTETEQLLEETLVRCPDLLMRDLKLVGRQTETPGGPLDLLGVDGDGELVVFELKRGTLTREAVAQVVDYASYLAELEPEDLGQHITERSGKLGIKKINDFQAWYQEQFGRSFAAHAKPRMVLVGLGVDDRTRRMVAFLADSDLDVSLITFHGFKQGEGILLARQLEVEARPAAGTPRGTKEENLAKMQAHVTNVGLGESYYELARFFQQQLSPSVYAWPNASGFSYYLLEFTESGSLSQRVYIATYLYDTRPGETEICVHARAIEAAGGAFETARNAIGDRFRLSKDGNAYIRIRPKEEWDRLMPVFKDLCAAMLEGWRAKRERQAHAEAEPEGVHSVGIEE